MRRISFQLKPFFYLSQSSLRAEPRRFKLQPQQISQSPSPLCLAANENTNREKLPRRALRLRRRNQALSLLLDSLISMLKGYECHLIISGFCLASLFSPPVSITAEKNLQKP
ncbi:hypothetical protein VNO78_13149 [Psophocarpus tetragonolobus]|uniref:Uncharacterized protein n=1 Tax=Psophocarpus tetragonolobus TaxID=3891 RepID=A0AAN9SPT5_PSOTE